MTPRRKNVVVPFPVSSPDAVDREGNNRRNKRRNDRNAALGKGCYVVRPIAYQRDKLAARLPPLRRAVEANDPELEISLLEGLLQDVADGDDVKFWEEDCTREDAWAMSRMSRRDKDEE